MTDGGAAAPPLEATQQVRCPSCGSLTLVTPGQASFCFSCGQPLPMDMTAKAPLGPYPLTGGIPVPTPPPNPYGAPPTPAPIVVTPAPVAATSFILSGSEGTFKVSAGGDVLVGRDPARCAIRLSEPRVSGVHATLKLEAGALYVRDERSNNGVWINGERITAGAWAQIPANAALRFGPIQFSVQSG